MSLTIEILNLRHHKQVSSVSILMGLLDWEKANPIDSRIYAAIEAADVVLTNVAAHAADALLEISKPASGLVRRRRATGNPRNRRTNHGRSVGLHRKLTS
jgi:hypothetical protein